MKSGASKFSAWCVNLLVSRYCQELAGRVFRFGATEVRDSLLVLLRRAVPMMRKYYSGPPRGIRSLHFSVTSGCFQKVMSQVDS